MRDWNVRPANRQKKKKLSLRHALRPFEPLHKACDSPKDQSPEEKPERANTDTSSSAPSNSFISQLSPRVPNIAHHPLKCSPDYTSRLSSTLPMPDKLHASKYVAMRAPVCNAQMCTPGSATEKQAAEHLCWPLALANDPAIEEHVVNTQISIPTTGYNVFVKAGPHLGLDSIHAHAGGDNFRSTPLRAYSQCLCHFPICELLEHPPQAMVMLSRWNSFASRGSPPAQEYAEAEGADAFIWPQQHSPPSLCPRSEIVYSANAHQLDFYDFTPPAYRPINLQTPQESALPDPQPALRRDTGRASGVQGYLGPDHSSLTSAGAPIAARVSSEEDGYILSARHEIHGIGLPFGGDCQNAQAPMFSNEGVHKARDKR